VAAKVGDVLTVKHTRKLLPASHVSSQVMMSNLLPLQHMEAWV
jgi:hypothetical protein